MDDRTQWGTNGGDANRNDGVDADDAGRGSYQLEANYGYMAISRYASGYDCAYAWVHWVPVH